MAVTRLSADAMVVTKAMRASTIAEIYVEADQVRVEFEVGAADLAAFRNILPDELYRTLTGEPCVLEQRRAAFLEVDWVILGDGVPLAGEIRRVAPGKRVMRDQVTGEPLGVQPDDANFVVEIGITYRLENPPESLTIRPPTSDGAHLAAANIGFVLYHRGVAVNDFRYLSQEETLDLDWEDPWHSRFRNRNLRRQFDSPISAFLYVEHFEVRKEIIIRPKDLQSWVDLGLENMARIPIQKQPEIKRIAAEFLAAKNPLAIDGREVEGKLDRIHFIRRTLRRTGVIDPPEELDVTSATLGVIFVYSIPELPQEVSMNWQLFTPKLQEIPAATADEVGGLPTRLTPNDPVLRWQNFLTDPQVPAMLTIPPLPETPSITIPIVSVVFGVGFLGIAAIGLCRRGRCAGKRALVACIVSVLCAVATLPFAHASITNPLASRRTLTREQKDEILTSLLQNTYRAFDRREESLVYDRLAMSVSGDLLTEVYLQTRRGMELEGQGGARVKVDGVDFLAIDAGTETESGGYIRRVRWSVRGSVGHWGHTHRRTTHYEADFRIEPREASWKITQMELLDQQRADNLPGSGTD